MPPEALAAVLLPATSPRQGWCGPARRSPGESRTGAAAAAVVAKTGSPAAPAGRWRTISVVAGAEVPAELIAAPAAGARAGPVWAADWEAGSAPVTGTATERGQDADRDRARAPCHRARRGGDREPWAGSAPAAPCRPGAVRGGRAGRRPRSARGPPPRPIRSVMMKARLWRQVPAAWRHGDPRVRDGRAAGGDRGVSFA
jgi:hypothetical protein